MNTPNETTERPTLDERKKQLEAEAKANNGDRKPKFGDSMRNPWASETNPQRDGYFVREKRVTGRINPGLWYQMTDGEGNFWETNGKVALFREARASLPPPAEPVQGVSDAWLPIESAPKDGTCILLGRAEDEENDRGAISTPGRWHDEDHDGPDNMGHDAGFMDDEFQEFAWGRSFGNSAYMNGGFQPTHWQPLPVPPAARSQQSTGGGNG